MENPPIGSKNWAFLRLEIKTGFQLNVVINPLFGSLSTVNTNRVVAMQLWGYFYHYVCFFPMRKKKQKRLKDCFNTMFPSFLLGWTSVSYHVFREKLKNEETV